VEEWLSLCEYQPRNQLPLLQAPVADFKGENYERKSQAFTAG
jgi:hypothetical protein